MLLIFHGTCFTPTVVCQVTVWFSLFPEPLTTSSHSAQDHCAPLYCFFFLPSDSRAQSEIVHYFSSKWPNWLMWQFTSDEEGQHWAKISVKNKARWVHFTGVPSKKENTRARTGMWSGLFYGHSAARLIRIPPGFLFTVQDVQKGHRGAFVRSIDASEKLQSAQTVCHILE